MIKICLIGMAVLAFICFAISGGHAWGAFVFEIIGAVWLIYCFNKFPE